MLHRKFPSLRLLYYFLLSFPFQSRLFAGFCFWSWINFYNGLAFRVLLTILLFSRTFKWFSKSPWRFRWYCLILIETFFSGIWLCITCLASIITVLLFFSLPHFDPTFIIFIWVMNWTNYRFRLNCFACFSVWTFRW